MPKQNKTIEFNKNDYLINNKNHNCKNKLKALNQSMNESCDKFNKIRSKNKTVTSDML